MKNIFLLCILFTPFCYSCFAQDSLLDSLTNKVQSRIYPNIDGIVILKGRDIAYEHYFNGYTKDSLHDSRSSFKSVTSLLVGIAVNRGLIKDLDQKVYSFFPEYTGQMDNWKKQMTIRNLLQMESGFNCDEWIPTIDCEQEMIKTNNWLNFSLDLSMKNQPGTVWAYTSCNPMILGGIISRVSGMNVMEFAKKYLFEPLGITQYSWTTDSAGNATTAGSFFIQPSDMIKIGELVRDKGIWNGKRIISETWINEATEPKVLIKDYSFIKLSRTDLAEPQPTYYGYYWYVENIKTATYNGKLLFASGNGGQYIIIIPNLDLVVVFTQSNYDSWKAKRAFDLLVRYIIPHFKQIKN